VLRQLAKERRYQELAELKRNIDNTQNIYYEVRTAILPRVSLPLNGKILRDQRRQTIKAIIYPKPFKDGPRVSRFNMDEEEVDDKVQINFQEHNHEEEEDYQSKRSSNVNENYPRGVSGGSSNINSFMDSRDHGPGGDNEEILPFVARVPARVNEGKH